MATEFPSDYGGGNDLLKIARVSLIAAAALALGAGPLQAQKGFGFEAFAGYTGLTGEYGSVLDGGVFAEGNGYYQTGHIRIGSGINVASLDVAEPIEIESWAQVELHAYVAYFLAKQAAKVKPYVQGRVGWVRFTPEDHRVEEGVSIEDLLAQEEEPEEGENTSPRVTGFDVGGVAGLEYSLSRRVALDLSALFTYISTEKVENLPETAVPPQSGGLWSVRFGVRWSI